MKTCVFLLILSLVTSMCEPIPDAKPLSSTSPVISKVYTTPIPIQGLWLTLPKKPGVVTIHVDAEHTSKVTFWLYPTGTGPKKCEFMGEDIDPSDGWSYQLEYGNRSLHTHFVVEAHGPGGTTFQFFNITTN
ncbi:hypothetical protein CBW65_20220 [Tumebacillus avium]|uniref:Uncharacterized protein n=1 Tax=Tumebacillus avium TaxID=1903704 RepID=A0A1Y0ISQ9_9BACL|nr:hypothetical protein [Tumebacillus avium]ARU63039.1 hypothetical protein CBW65_20220 [Tumebacillus avium]